jgi:hypothetical protein
MGLEMRIVGHFHKVQSLVEANPNLLGFIFAFLVGRL